jgi:predicted acyl esterase
LQGSVSGGAMLDKLVTKMEILIPARDGILLFTRLYLPFTIPSDGLPTVLMRNPYTFPEDELRYDDNGEFFTSHGYAFIVQDIRGRGRSSGAFDVGNVLIESQDGFDACEWIALQAWSNKKIGSLGCSYPGFSSVATAIDNPYVKVVISDDPSLDSRSDFHYPGHIPTLWLLNWLFRLDHGVWAPPEVINFLGERIDPKNLDEELLGRIDSNWRKYLDLYENMDSFNWETHSLVSFLDRICAPVLILTAFPNLSFSPLTIIEGLRELGCPEQKSKLRFIFTREGHCYHSGRIPYERTWVNQIMLDYLDVYLKDKDISFSTLGKYIIEESGENNYWCTDSWPIHNGESILYLTNQNGQIDRGKLSFQAGSGNTVNWEIDPEIMVAEENDYPELIFRSDPFEQNLLIAGKVTIDLWIETTSPDLDFFAYLYEKTQSGEEQLLCRAAIRAKYRHNFIEKKWLVNQDPVLLKLTANDFVYTIKAGNFLELHLTNNRPFSIENPLTGVLLLEQTFRGNSRISLHLDQQYSSKVVLPVITQGKTAAYRR